MKVTFVRVSYDRKWKTTYSSEWFREFDTRMRFLGEWDDIVDGSKNSKDDTLSCVFLGAWHKTTGKLLCSYGPMAGPGYRRKEEDYDDSMDR